MLWLTNDGILTDKLLVDSITGSSVHDPLSGGWVRVVSSILSDIQTDLLFIDYVDHVFNSRLVVSYPMLYDWFGFFHHPPSSSTFHLVVNNVIKCQHKCKVLFVFSQYLADHLSQHLTCPIKVVDHPTETNNIQSWSGKIKYITTIGTWLRQIEPICKINTDLPKMWLVGSTSSLPPSIIRACAKYTDKLNIQSVKSDEYQQILSTSLVVLQLKDTSVNNALLECIARKVPLIINRHPAIVEKLGNDYPLYADTDKEIQHQIDNFDHKVYQAYLFSILKMEKRLDFDNFIQTVREKLDP